MGNLRVVVSCSKLQVSVLCPCTDIFGFFNTPQEYVLSKASSSLAVILSICSPTEVALDNGQRRQPKSSPCSAV